MSGARVIRGDPGIGKTALLDATTAGQSGIRLIRIDGFEAEASIPYAALHRVGLSLQEFADALSPQLRAALGVAWGSHPGPTPDRFLVGLAMLALCAAAGSVGPLVCVMDDAHWLDAESLAVLGFVARRLTAESTVFLFAARDSDDTDTALAGIESIRLAGLDSRSVVQLLTGVLPEGCDPFAAQQIAQATGGNPLALVDLARDLSLRQISDLTLSDDPVPLRRQLEVHYSRQARDLPEDVQTWLLVAAIASGGSLELIEGAAAYLQLPPDCGSTAARSGLVSLGQTVTFRHPLVRSAIYGAISGAQRRRIHAILAEQAGALGLEDLEVWHAAEAASGADPAVADRLERVAQRAGSRGGLVSQARLLSRAASLTPNGSLRNERLLAAAEVAGSAGAAHLSRELLDRIDGEKLDGVQLGRRLTAEAQWAMFVADPDGIRRGPVRLLEAAEHSHGADCIREQKALLKAFEYALVTELLMEGTTLKELGERLRAGAACRPGPFQVVLDGLAAHILLPYSDAVPAMRTAVATLAALEDEQLQDFGFVGIALTTALFDVNAGSEYLSRVAGFARDNGALRALDAALWVRSMFEVGRGDPAAAGGFIEQVRELRRAIGYEAENVVNVSLLAWTGTPAEHVAAIGEIVNTMGFGGVYTSAQDALAAREIAEGQYDAAYERLGQMIARPFLQVTYFVLAGFVEAAVRSNHMDDARSVAADVAAMAAAAETPWLRALDHRCRALVSADGEAEAHYQAALAAFAETVVPAEVGRTHLLYGEWLRRRKRRKDARTQLRTALGIFDRIQAPAFAQRARTELAATGEQPGSRELVAGVEMAPREAAVAGMAAAGATNADIAAALFISVNTVDYHLRKVFQKLGVSSRRQLAERFERAD